MISPRRIAVIATVVILAVAVLAIGMVMRRDSSDIPTMVVKAGPFSRRVTAEGELRAVKSTAISSPNRARKPMKIASLLRNGTSVKKGDILITFDPTDFQVEYDEGQSLFATARNNLGKQGVVSAGTESNLRLDAQQAQREYESASQFAHWDPEIFSRFIVIESDIDQTLALERRDSTNRVRGTLQEQAAADRELIQIEQRKATIKIDGAREGLDALTIRAEHDGIFVLKPSPWSEELPTVGMTVWRGFPLAELPDLTAMEAEIFVLEADAGGLKAGLPARVVVESRPEKAFRGKLKSVEPLAKPRLSNVPVQYFSAVVELTDSDPLIMKPGSRVRAMLTLEQKDAAISIPRQALFERKGKTVVYRKSKNSFLPVEVTVGSSSPGTVIIEKGLAAGDVIALRDPNEETGEQP